MSTSIQIKFLKKRKLVKRSKIKILYTLLLIHITQKIGNGKSSPIAFRQGGNTKLRYNRENVDVDKKRDKSLNENLWMEEKPKQVYYGNNWQMIGNTGKKLVYLCDLIFLCSKIGVESLLSNVHQRHERREWITPWIFVPWVKKGKDNIT